jgi:hypothetical protein
MCLCHLGWKWLCSVGKSLRLVASLPTPASLQAILALALPNLQVKRRPSEKGLLPEEVN